MMRTILVACQMAWIGMTIPMTMAFMSPLALTRVLHHHHQHHHHVAHSSWMKLKSSSDQQQQQQQEVMSASDPMEEAMMDTETRKMMEKMKRAQELREQEVFMKKSLGKFKCRNCEWEYDETKGDVMMIGGMIQPGTVFSDLPSNWRCPVCRASKDSFEELVEEIPGFAVNQGYGFGTNSWTAGQKNLAIFGGLALFFLLFLSGYALT